MSQDRYSILIASHAGGKTWQLSISRGWLKVSALLGFIGTILAITAVLDYFGLLIQANQNRFLRAENEALRQKFSVAEEKLSSLEASLERIQNFTKKLNLITDVDDENRILRLAMSPETRQLAAAQVVPSPGSTGLVQRAPASEFMIREPQPVDRPFAEPRDGELSVSRETNRDYATLSVRIDRALKTSQLREQGVLQLWDSLSERQSLLAATPSVKPTRGHFTSRFGYRMDPVSGRPQMHAGLDMAAPPGTPVFAPADGVVSFVGYDGGYGKLVSIDHGYGVITRYGHNSRVFVEQGQKVRRFDVIAAVGSTGKSTGAHLHYEVRVHGIAVDPINYILNE
jgi:murein DD-endopeptidase MepM/ murein hydrolase activator NlpD